MKLSEGVRKVKVTVLIYKFQTKRLVKFRHETGYTRVTKDTPNLFLRTSEIVSRTVIIHESVTIKKGRIRLDSRLVKKVVVVSDLQRRHGL